MNCVRNKRYDLSILQNVEYAVHHSADHLEVFKELQNKQPYTVTVLIENLDYKLWKRKEYVKYTKIERNSNYTQQIFKMFFKEYGEREGNDVYAKWLDKYRPTKKEGDENFDVDKLIFEKELEPRYKAQILKRFKNHEALFKPRYYFDRERIYNLPPPLNWVDWRNPYDNIFIWHDGDKKYFLKGGSGSSGGRQNNSVYIFGYALINRQKPVPSYLFIYDNKNTLWFAKKFKTLCVPAYDIGSNYHLQREEETKALKGTKLFQWEILREPIKEIHFVRR